MQRRRTKAQQERATRTNKNETTPSGGVPREEDPAGAREGDRGDATRDAARREAVDLAVGPQVEERTRRVVAPRPEGHP